MILMSDRLEQTTQIEAALYTLTESDLGQGAIRLFQALNYPVSGEVECMGFNPGQFVHLQFGHNLLFSQEEWDYLNSASSISSLFELKIEDVCSSIGATIKYDPVRILFLAIDLSCDLTERSKAAHSITKILNKGYKQPVFMLFRNRQSIAFSGLAYESAGDEATGKAYLSEWVSCILFEEVDIDRLRLLSFEYHNSHDMKEYFLDMIYSVARNYYLYKESYITVMTDYVIRGYHDLVPTGVNFGSASAKQLARECFVHHRDLYGFDFVHEDDYVELFLPDEEDWFSGELVEVDDALDDVREDLGEELRFCDDDGVDIEHYVPDDVPDEYFDDPITLLEFLESMF